MILTRECGSQRKTKRITDITADNILWDTEAIDDAAAAAEDPEGACELVTRKRVRKERVVLLNGRGTGYGAAVPVLLESLERPRGDDAAESSSPRRARGRQWQHQHFCVLCGKSKNPDSISRCAHCPRAFHQVPALT